MTVLDAVRMRPGMYIGDTRDGSGLHKMLYEIVDNAINEARAGHCDRIDVQLNAGGSATVRDNGRGISTDPREPAGISAAEFVMTHFDPGKAARDARKRSGSQVNMQTLREGIPLAKHHVASGGLRSTGLVIVNALSDLVDLRIWRDGREHFIRFRRGDPEAPLAVVGDAGMRDGNLRRGTEITLLPSPAIFAKTAFDFATIEHHLCECAGRNPGVTITLADNRGIEKQEVVLRI